MKALHLGSIIVLCVLLGGCANPLMQPAPRASIGDFTDNVLEPLALRVADEKIMEASTALKFEHTPKAPIQALAGLLDEVPWIGKLLSVRNVSQRARLEEDLAWLETRRLPLKRELLTLFVSRTTAERETFTVCVDAVQRRYQALDVNRFTRLSDGPGPCDLTNLSSLQRAQSPLRHVF